MQRRPLPSLITRRRQWKFSACKKREKRRHAGSPSSLQWRIRGVCWVPPLRLRMALLQYCPVSLAGPGRAIAQHRPSTLGAPYTDNSSRTPLLIPGSATSHHKKLHRPLPCDHSNKSHYYAASTCWWWRARRSDTTQGNIDMRIPCQGESLCYYSVASKLESDSRFTVIHNMCFSLSSFALL